MNNNSYNQTEQRIKRELADYLGIEPADIDDDSVLTEDLHMKATDLADFAQILENLSFDTSNLDFSEIETFSDMIDAVTAHE